MPLDPLTEQAVTNWLLAHCPGLRCPACGAQQFRRMELAYSPLAQTPPPGLGLDTLPLVYVLCEACKCTLAFSAAAMGVVPPA